MKLAQSDAALLQNTERHMLMVMLRKVKRANDADTKRQRSAAAFARQCALDL